MDNSKAETHTSIYSISESPKDKAMIWVGTDDGNVQVTRDGGAHWTNTVANIRDLPKGEWVSWVEASKYDAGTAYAAFDRHTFGDMTPYLYKTNDYGKSWRRIASPEQGVRGYVHVIREDRVNPDLLFMGTEFGLWISVDGGKGWAQFKGGDMPDVAVRDIAIQPQKDDLVIATHGRGIWIVDDISPLRGLTPETLAATSTLMQGRPTIEKIQGNGGWAEGDATYVGSRPRRRHGGDLLPEDPPRLRQAQDRGAERQGRSDRQPARVGAQGDQPGDLVHARAAAARVPTARRRSRVCLDPVDRACRWASTPCA